MTGLIALGVVNVSAPKIGGETPAAAAAENQPKLLLTVAIAKSGNALTVNGAKVIKGNIDCSNGMIHVIDTVLLPK